MTKEKMFEDESFAQRFGKELYLEEIFLEYDGIPLLSACIDENGNRYFCHCAEMRDFETISVAITAAETGHLILSTLHTLGAANTIDRVIDAFPPNQQQQIRTQLSMVLDAVICQQLVPTLDGGERPVFEIMFLNNAIRNMIRESKTHQIDGIIATSQEEGMISMDNSLLALYRQNVISKDTAIIYSSNTELMEKKIARL
mgnify:CR=1 FL=1